jgi:hypothetical protein
MAKSKRQNQGPTTTARLSTDAELARHVAKRGEVRDFVVQHDLPEIGFPKIMVNAQRFYGDDRGVQRIAVAFEDVTDRTAAV